jgi:hypothetical protein
MNRMNMMNKIFLRFSKKKFFLAMLLVLLFSLAAFIVVSAQVSDGFDLSWYVVSGGGGNSESGDYVLSSTVGQTAAGESTSGGIIQTHGFWQTFVDTVRTLLPIAVKH